MKPSQPEQPSSGVPILNVAALTAPMQGLHDSGENFSYKWRRSQLLTLAIMLKHHWNEWTEALRQDLGKCRVEALAMELLMVQTDLVHSLSHLHQWMKRQPIASPAICAPAFSYLTPRPLIGPAVLVIGPSNYPVSLVLHPMIGALAAGNPVVCKPSELTPTVEALFAKLIPQYFRPDCVICVTGGIPETTALLNQPWGHIFFTGSSAVGKIVAAAAAATLTPVTLELGGKAPCFVDAETCPKFDINLVANRILWSKTVNGGQTCAATDTLIVEESLLPKLLPALKSSLVKMFGEDPRRSELGRIVSSRHAERLVNMIAQVERSDHKTTKVITGGSKLCDAAACYVAPTIIVNPPMDAQLMQEEIFGPILPIITVKSRTEAIEFMKKMPGTPLCLYVFTSSDTVFQDIVRQVPAGSVMRNDCLVHLSSPFIKFGGLGSSGYGGYHGKYSFDLFSHLQPVMYRPCFPGFDLNMLRYHPFGGWKGFLVTDVAVVLPSIPVLHCLFIFRILCVVVVFGILSNLLPLQMFGFLQTSIEHLATALDGAATFLRQ